MIFYKNERKQVAQLMRRLYKQNLTSSSGGNVSMRTEDGKILLTSSQKDKSKLKWQDVAVIDSDGTLLTPDIKPSMEINIHKKIYIQRPDVFAIVHAHPIYATTYAVSTSKINTNLTGESRFILGEITYIEYCLMGTEELADKCATGLKSSNIAIMKNHGALCLGKNLFEAFDRMEVLEYVAQMNFNLEVIKNSKPLPQNEVKKIDKLKNHYN
jgi:L-fuculose-phosphate aldolase